MKKELIINSFVKIFRFWLIVRPSDLKKAFIKSLNPEDVKQEYENDEFWEMINKAIIDITNRNSNYETMSDVILIKEIETFLNNKVNF